jgi:hypothetical protein
LVSVFLVSDDFPVLYDQAFEFFLIKLLKVVRVVLLIVVNNIQKMLLSGHSRAEVIGLEEALEMRKEGRVSV